MANTNKQMVDLPFFELCNQAPTATSSVSSMTTAEDGSDRYIYYMAGALFYRYDTVGDTWQQLATPNVAPSSVVTMRYTKTRGYHGRILSATSNTVTLPSLRGRLLDGETLTINSGAGMGQTRQLTFVNETIHDSGVITGTTTSSLVDTVKKWRVNQWAGYTVGINFGTDATQYKQILYNDANTLYIADVNLQPHDPWNNQQFVAVAPYALPASTAGSQSHYVIMSATFSVTNWTTVPDYTSRFKTLSGGLYVISSAAAAPFFTLQYYDVLHDSWQTKTVPQSLILAALGTDFTAERTGKLGNALATSTGAVSGTIRTISDAGASWLVSSLNNCRVLITAGTGIGQHRRIVNNTSTTLTIGRNWDIIPDSTSTFEVWPDWDRLYLNGGGNAAMYAYSPEFDAWMQGQHFDNGVTNNIAAIMSGSEAIGVTSGTRIAAGIVSVNTTPTAGGSGYVVGDVLTCSVGGTGGQVIVNAINSTGAVTNISLVHSGTATGFTSGAGKAITGGTGTGCTIEITAVGPTALITFASNTWFAAGQTITFMGCTDSAWNAPHTILGVNSPSQASVAVTAAANMVAAAAQTTTVIVDASQNWIVNEHVGRLVHVMVAGQAPTSQVRWIVSNTATTLTVATITAASNGTSKYVIYDSKIFGIDTLRKETNRGNTGQATSGSTTTLQDTTKNWVVNQWAGFAFKVEAGTGYGSGRITIVSNTADTLTYATQSFTPDATTRYEIADMWGLITTGGTTTPVTDTSKTWVVNQLAGKRFRITGGTSIGQETSVTSNTSNAITSGALTATDTTSTYAICGIPARGAGTQLIWVWGSSDNATNARLMYSPRGGGSNTLDIYDITTGRWTYGIYMQPQGELFNTGSSYSYDGGNIILMSRSVASGPIRVFSYDVTKNKIIGSRTTTITQNAVHVGNLMEIVTSPTDNYDYVYCLQNTGTLLCRSLVF